MDNAAIELLSRYGIFGIFGILFIWLFIWVLKENSKREEQYQKIIAKLTESLPGILDSNKRIEEKIDEHIVCTNTVLATIKEAVRK